MKIRIIDYGVKILPTRAHPYDAGSDVYVPEACVIPARSSIRIPLGFGVEIPAGHVGYVMSRSGLSSMGISCETPPIDTGYTGQVHAVVTNHTNSDYRVHEGDRIGQLVVLPVILADYTLGDVEKRGDAGFGSTGK